MAWQRILAICAKNKAPSATLCPLLIYGCALMPKNDLDAIDCRIVAALQADGRLTNVDLAERIGLSPSPCLRRVKRLERDGYIDTYRAVLDRARVGLGFTVFVGVRLEAHANDRAGSFEEAVLEMREVIACHMVSGTVAYMIADADPD